MRILCFCAYATTSRKGASVLESGDGAVRFRARNDIGDNGKRPFEEDVKTIQMLNFCDSG